ncbi:unnamed protein product [Microthlaspi erraticum]|uniref:KIB1-4 beta-propeller domain-containing protein n=1 Tax=Microthlaspi erraticum TaxID=1685480 RepID=A0A6D2ICH8_9BRAS|nr:unnamed protein product [Microthlaspi erraticum]
MIMSLLIVRDCIRASQVCMAWYRSSASIRKKDRHLWLMKYDPISSTINMCEMYDPSHDMITYTMEVPEITSKVICYSKDGWLLMGNESLTDLLFFNAFTRKLINLPTCGYYFECVIFTCAPTSDCCLVFGLANSNGNLVAVNTLRLGETEWETSQFLSPNPLFAWCNKIIFSGGLFYCLGRCGSVAAVFNPSERTWNTHQVKCGKGFTHSTVVSYGTFFVEIKGDLFFINTLGEKLQVFRLKRDEEWGWEEKTRIEEGFTVFGSSYALEARSDIPCNLRDKIFLADSLDYHHPAMQNYVFEEGKYLQTNPPDSPWDLARHISQSVWIEPPKQLLEFI